MVAVVIKMAHTVTGVDCDVGGTFARISLYTVLIYNTHCTLNSHKTFLEQNQMFILHVPEVDDSPMLRKVGGKWQLQFTLMYITVSLDTTTRLVPKVEKDTSL